MKRGIISYNFYKIYVNRLRRLLNLAESEYYVNKLNSLGGYFKKNWNILNELLNKKKDSLPANFSNGDTMVSDPTEISNLFNSYFTHHPQSIYESISTTSTDFSLLIYNRSRSMSFLYSTRDEVHNIIMASKKKGLKFLSGPTP